jgi:hypothetical protein
MGVGKFQEKPDKDKTTSAAGKPSSARSKRRNLAAAGASAS